MKESLKETSFAWKKIAEEWKTYFAPPSRTSPGEEEQYRKWLAELAIGKESQKGLVLGATPELRDGMVEHGYDLTSVDINPEMFRAMDELRKSIAPNEQLIEASWLDMPLEDDSFDVVVGDAVLPNVPWEERDRFLSEIKRVLKPGGVFLTRAFYVPREKRFSSIDEIFEHFSKKEATVQSTVEMAFELLMLTHDDALHAGSFTEAKRLLDEYHKKHGATFESENLQKMHDVIESYWLTKLLGKTWIFAYREEEEEQYRKHFTIEKTFESPDHDYSHLTPMYFLRG